MADMLLDEQGTPTTPANGQMVLYPDSSSSTFVQRNDAGRVQGDDARASIVQQAGFATDTYLTNSGLQIPSCSMQAGMIIEWEIIATKTAAGSATPIYQVRIGANQSVADTSRLSMTGSAQTAAADTAYIIVRVVVRTVSATGVVQGFVQLQHNLAATGFASTPAGFALVQATSAGFDNTNLGGQYIGLSINGGASAAWTIEMVTARIDY